MHCKPLLEQLATLLRQNAPFDLRSAAFWAFRWPHTLRPVVRGGLQAENYGLYPGLHDGAQAHHARLQRRDESSILRVQGQRRGRGSIPGSVFKSYDLGVRDSALQRIDSIVSPRHNAQFRSFSPGQHTSNRHFALRHSLARLLQCGMHQPLFLSVRQHYFPSLTMSQCIIPSMYYECTARLSAMNIRNLAGLGYPNAMKTEKGRRSELLWAPHTPLPQSKHGIGVWGILHRSL